jgi:hypothetical protein
LARIADAGEAARLLVHRAGDLEGAGEVDALGQDGLDRDHRGRHAALHVAGAAAIDLAVAHHAGEGIDAPALADLDHVDVAVEVDRRARAGARPDGPAR